MAGKGLELPLIVCTKSLGKGRVKFILNLNTGNERLNLSFYYGERVKPTVKE